ncbi:hypothetical protein [Sphingomicrobium nitratireducens]|uniref:hypothetical protein n=1 Tax=Sphingomicrobium nitratireducens TaxID=2964666 RepID=UPI0022401DBC|nr:hypothetical protein [Sphingomicrobium nitratireducens]
MRNISAGGALLEGGGLPAKNSAARLTYASEEKDGVLVWSCGGRAGIKFNSDEDIERLDAAAGLRQSRVDNYVQLVRLGGSTQTEVAEATETSIDWPSRLSEELIYIQRRLENLGNVLSCDPILVVRHARQLQDIDIVMQNLEHLAHVAKAENKIGAIREIGREDLKHRLLRR